MPRTASQVFVRAGANERTLEVPSTVGGLAFAPKGLRLAVSHYNGATLWFPNARSEPAMLAWKGSHLAVRFTPDGRFVVTSMQEPGLHCWRLSDRKDMRMSGYSARVRSLAFAADGKSLATSGADSSCRQPKVRGPTLARNTQPHWVCLVSHHLEGGDVSGSPISPAGSAPVRACPEITTGNAIPQV